MVVSVETPVNRKAEMWEGGSARGLWVMKGGGKEAPAQGSEGSGTKGYGQGKRGRRERKQGR